ncbi:hypothetical protein CHQ57_12115 [Aeromonas salmonicida]|nr:hypothetical protein CHQ57_12115 [Aeromonas salmonicida]
MVEGESIVVIGGPILLYEQRTLKSFSMCAEFSVIFMDFQYLAMIENLFTDLYLHLFVKLLILNEISIPD